MSRVVVVGAGPTGLMLAVELRLAGVETVVVERLEQPSGQSRALALHARSVELLAQRGILGPFLEEGTKGEHVHYAGVPLEMARIDGRHRYSLHIHQSRVERLLEDAAVRLGADVRRGHELAGLLQDDDGVEAAVRTSSGTVRLRCDYLVGCDGGGSLVRKLAGIGFPGTASELWGILGDVGSFDASVDLRRPLAYPHGMVGVSPLGDGLYRVMCVESGAPPPGDAPVTAAELRATIRRITGADLAFGEPRWLSRFGDATRQADRYRSGRVLLAGDAAHIHFPLGAQGMNLGMQDAANLGWKLAAEIGGWAPPGLLDTYESERRPVGARVCADSRAQIALTFPAERSAPARDLLAELLRFDDVHRHMVETVAGVATRYPVDGDPELGRRVPDVSLATPGGDVNLFHLLRRARGVLLDLSDGALSDGGTPPLPDGWSGRVDAVTAKPVTGLPPALLIRPDGHAVWAGDAGRLPAALRSWFGEPGPR
ncbi:FAD-dependent monooxygenase [Actinomadura sp. GTD37]|uniref:FAD-dependent monooxygenase n=1 Tax=Actinomadura sp. GTD37 TaxID=1778030 RepID=UPI0035C12791